LPPTEVTAPTVTYGYIWQNRKGYMRAIEIASRKSWSNNFGKNVTPPSFNIFKFLVKFSLVPFEVA